MTEALNHINTEGRCRKVFNGAAILCLFLARYTWLPNEPAMQCDYIRLTAGYINQTALSQMLVLVIVSDHLSDLMCYSRLQVTMCHFQKNFDFSLSRVRNR